MTLPRTPVYVTVFVTNTYVRAMLDIGELYLKVSTLLHHVATQTDTLTTKIGDALIAINQE